ncbi:unnamed protein product [Lota lota]
MVRASNKSCHVRTVSPLLNHMSHPSPSFHSTTCKSAVHRVSSDVSYYTPPPPINRNEDPNDLTLGHAPLHSCLLSRLRRATICLTTSQDEYSPLPSKARESSSRARVQVVEYGETPVSNGST